MAGHVRKDEVFFPYFCLERNGRVRLRKISARSVSVWKTQRRKRTLEIIEELLKHGFTNPFTYRDGPCDLCHVVEETYWQPEIKKWICALCFYSLTPLS